MKVRKEKKWPQFGQTKYQENSASFFEYLGRKRILLFECENVFLDAVTQQEGTG
jgi:hypothetical protein